MFMLPGLQRVNTPDSIRNIVHVLSIFPHFGVMANLNGGKDRGNIKPLSFFGKGDLENLTLLKVFSISEVRAVCYSSPSG